MTMTFFEGMSATRVRRALNVLLEAPFFYPEDDPELFAWMRRHRVELARFLSEVFDWQLVIEPEVARVHKSAWHNAAITPKQRAGFEPTRAGECIALLLLLELDSKVFSMGELLAHGARRTTELGLSARFDAPALRDLYRELMPTLIKHRLVREIAPFEGTDLEAIKRYEKLPGLELYDRAAIDDVAVRTALGRPS